MVKKIWCCLRRNVFLVEGYFVGFGVLTRGFFEWSKVILCFGSVFVKKCVRVSFDGVR